MALEGTDPKSNPSSPRREAAIEIPGPGSCWWPLSVLGHQQQFAMTWEWDLEVGFHHEALVGPANCGTGELPLKFRI